MARKPITDLSAWPSLSLEGNLIAPAKVAEIAAPGKDEATRQSYRIRKGLSIRDEISTAFRVGQSHFDAFKKQENPSAEATRRFVHDFLKETLGFDDLAPLADAVAFLAGGRVPVVVVPPSDEKLDRRSPTLSLERSRSPAFALQDYLNDHDDALWGLVTNGTVMRLMRDNASLTRPAYIEANLSQIFTNEDAASFSVFWLLFHRTRFGNAAAPVTDCALERWREDGTKTGEVARERLAEQVRDALAVLGTGFLEANPELVERLHSGQLSLTEWFNELLRLVYRLIFLMVAEDRNLLHPAKTPAQVRQLYAEGYSLAALRAQCVRRTAWDRHCDRYEGLKIVFKGLCLEEPKLGLPALGGLFAAENLPHLGTARLRNRAFMEAVYRLGWLTEENKSGIVPVNWQAMETEELGSVYESLLELQPQLSDNGRSLQFAKDATEKKGNQRKLTGSYYTPDSLVQALLDTALDPVLDQAQSQSEDPVKALLKLSVIDPACGSGHFLLAAARRIATRVARIRAEGTPSLEDFRHALRDVARTCIHGVDRNPMAVELTKVALWIETVDPGLPLGFFDAQIRCGDALLGVFDLKVLKDGIPDAAYKALAGDNKPAAKYYEKANKGVKKGQGLLDFGAGQSNRMPELQPLAVNFSEFRALPEETLAQIGTKAKRFEQFRQNEAFARVRNAADLYVAAFLLPKTGNIPNSPSDHTVPTSDELWMALSHTHIPAAMEQAIAVARRAKAFHWPLEFPDIMQRGGFDVVLGNPPWERIKLQEQEFFAARSPEIAAAPNKAEREKRIKALSTAPEGQLGHTLFTAFLTAKRDAEATSEFVRTPEKEGGRFPLTGCGDVNTYALFAELFAKLGSRRAGVIVPTGIATDATTAPFFASLVEGKRLAQLVDFENSLPFFRTIHYSTKFCLLTLGYHQTQPSFSFFLTDPAQLADPKRNFTLSPESIARLNPNTRTAPVFRSKADAELTAKIYAHAPILIEESKGKSGNPWGISFMAMLHMSNDSHLFRTAVQLADSGWQRAGTDWVKDEERYVPLYEAKMISFYDHRFAGYGTRGSERGYRVLPETKHEEHENPSFEPDPFYWISKEILDARLLGRINTNWLLGWKDITAATNERTLIPAVFPRIGAGDTLLIMTPDHSFGKARAGLIANLSSLITDYTTRQKIGGMHLKYNIIKQIPILPPDFYIPAHITFITPRVLELTYTSHNMAPFARDLGYEGHPFPWNEARRAQLRAELDAFYARAYGLTRDELRYILDPSEAKAPDYPSETFRVLKKKEIRQYGEYRTRRLVLKAWDEMETSGHWEEEQEVSWQDRDFQLKAVIRKPLTDYRMLVWPELLRQLEGDVEFDVLRKAYWLLSKPAEFERMGKKILPSIPDAWWKSRTEQLRIPEFFDTLKGSVELGDLKIWKKNGTRFVRWTGTMKTNPYPEAIDDARIALLVAQLWDEELPDTEKTILAAIDSNLKTIESL